MRRTRSTGVSRRWRTLHICQRPRVVRSRDGLLYLALARILQRTTKGPLVTNSKTHGFKTLRRWCTIVALALLGTVCVVTAALFHSDRIGRYDEANALTRAMFDANIAFAASMTMFGCACLLSAWMAFQSRRLEPEEWAAGSQTTREILAGLLLFLGALVAASQIPAGDAAQLLSDIGNGLPVFLAVGVWVLILGPGKSSYVHARGLTPTYERLAESPASKATRTTVPILRPGLYALTLFLLITANIMAAIYFAADRQLENWIFILEIGSSELLVVALLFLSCLASLNMIGLWLVRRSPATDTFELLTTCRPLIFVNALFLFTWWYNLFVLPVFSVAGSALAVAVVTVLGPGFFLTWCGPTLTQIVYILRRNQHGSARSSNADPHANEDSQHEAPSVS